MNSDRELVLLFRTFQKNIEKIRALCIAEGMDDFLMPSLEVYPDCSGGVIFLHDRTNQITDLEISNFDNFKEGIEKLEALAR